MVSLSRIRSTLLAASCCVLSAAAADAQFETRGTFLAQPNSSPVSIAVGDFNHDGKPDLAVVSYCCGGSGVSILLGRGDGTFDPGVVYAAGDQPYSVVAADFDQDGNLDLAVANSLSPYLTILLGNGDGTFRYGPQSPKTEAYNIYVTTGDFNNDGIPDLLVVSNSDPCLCLNVLFGNGDGTFQQAVTTDPPFDVLSIGVGDFNRDGKLDVATAGDYSVNILLGNGNGTFRYGASYAYPTQPGLMTTSDLRADDKIDLILSNLFGGVDIFLGNGDGTFQTPVEYYSPGGGANVVATDINGDHKVDLAVAEFSFPSGVSVLLGNGDGTFQPAQFYPGGHETSWVAVGDFNGDRKPDLVRADYLDSGVSVLLNTGAVTFSPVLPLDFKNQAVGTTSAPQTVTLTNAGTSELKIASIKASAEFAVTSTCGKAVAAGANCTISATFSPTKQGAAQGTITIIDSASTKPQVIELLGTGTEPPTVAR